MALQPRKRIRARQGGAAGGAADERRARLRKGKKRVPRGGRTAVMRNLEPVSYTHLSHAAGWLALQPPRQVHSDLIVVGRAVTFLPPALKGGYLLVAKLLFVIFRAFFPFNGRGTRNAQKRCV